MVENPQIARELTDTPRDVGDDEVPVIRKPDMGANAVEACRVAGDLAVAGMARWMAILALALAILGFVRGFGLL